MSTTTSYPFTVSHRDIFRIALPASLAFITQPLVGIVDIAVIGRLGDAGLLGGLELGALTFGSVFAMLFFLRLGTAGLTAQSVGRQDPNQGLVHLLRAAMVGLVLGLLLLALVKPIQSFGVLAFAPPGPVVTNAFLNYLAVRMFGAPFVLLNFAFLGWFYGRGAAKTGMFLQIGVNVINIGLSILFVHSYGWGVSGVAAASVIAEAGVAMVSIGVVWWQVSAGRRLKTTISLKQLLDSTALWRMFDLSRDLMIRSAALMGTFAFFSAQMSRAGEIPLAASAVLLNFSMVTAYFLDGQAQAAEFYCGKAVGANYRPAFEQAWHLSAFWGLVIGFGLFVVWLAGGPLLIDLLTTNAEVRLAAREHLFVAAFIAFSGVIAFVMDGVMTGATLNTIIRNGMLASTVIYIGAAYWLQNQFGLGGLWIALHVFFVARGVIFWIAVRARLTSIFS